MQTVACPNVDCPAYKQPENAYIALPVNPGGYDIAATVTVVTAKCGRCGTVCVDAATLS